MKGRESGMPDEETWESFFNPRCVLERLRLNRTPGDVGEFGCGYGTFTLPAAHLATGTVHALDIEPEMVAATHQRAEAEGLRNVSATVRDFVADGTGRPDASIGAALLFNILHIEAPVALMRAARRALVPGGIAGIIHWRSDIPTPRGPSFDIRPSPVQCQSWGESAGLELVRFESLDCCRWHWGLVMRRPVE